MFGKSQASTCVVKAEPCKLGIKRRKLGRFKSCFTLQTSDYDVIIDLRDDSKSSTMSFKKCKRHDDLITTHAIERQRLSDYSATMQLT